jgi:hypothetical protein
MKRGALSAAVGELVQCEGAGHHAGGVGSARVTERRPAFGPGGR